MRIILTYFEAHPILTYFPGSLNEQFELFGKLISYHTKLYQCHILSVYHLLSKYFEKEKFY